MPRTARSACGGICYHVINRGNGRMRIFRRDPGYDAFMGLSKGKQRGGQTKATFLIDPEEQS